LLQAQFTAALSSVPPPDAPSSLQDDSVAGLSQLVRVCSLVDRLDGRTDPGMQPGSRGRSCRCPVCSAGSGLTCCWRRCHLWQRWSAPWTA
jgi:hypothetical protein